MVFFRITIFLLLVAGISSVLRAQPIYSFLQDDTATKSLYQKQALQKKMQLVGSVSKAYKKDYVEAYEGMCGMADDLLQSSRTITEKHTDNYIKAVAANIINANKELQGIDVRIVFTRDFIPNAYSIGEGTIAFNAGLFVYLQTEAEMAFVIAHELAHYYLNHSINRIHRYVQLKNSDSLKKEIKRIVKEEYSINQKLTQLLKAYTLDIRRHSRDKEAEADKMGLHFLSNTGYTGKGFMRTMQVLDKIDDTALFHPPSVATLLHTTAYPFKQRWIKKETSIFAAMTSDEEDEKVKKEKDSLKTHPDCKTRLLALQEDALKISGADFLVDKNYFLLLKEELIPELLEEMYRSKNISYNLYFSLQMLPEKKWQSLAVYNILRAFNLIYEYQKKHEVGIIVETENKHYAAAYNDLLRMLSRITLQEIADLNYSFGIKYTELLSGNGLFEIEKEKALAYKNQQK
ncbi:MAG: hypothetical protein RIR12_893 [Bacteroidota bacterium]|jgi:Zn-dependent protease with chaperone function